MNKMSQVEENTSNMKEITIKRIMDICLDMTDLENRIKFLKKMSLPEQLDLQIAKYEEAIGNEGEEKKLYKEADKSSEELNILVDMYDTYVKEVELEVGKLAHDFIKSLLGKSSLLYFYAGEAFDKYKFGDVTINISEVAENSRDSFLEQISKISDKYFSVVECDEGISLEIENELERLKEICKEINALSELENKKVTNDSRKSEQECHAEQEKHRVNFMRRRGR